MKRKYIILITVVVIAIAAGIYVYAEYNRENKNVADMKAEAIMDASALIRAFEQDSASVGKKYIDKVVQVTGTVKSVDTSGVISLGQQGEMSSVQCMMDKRHAVDYSFIKEGSQLSVKGKCNGFQSDELLGTDVKMNFCVITK